MLRHHADRVIPYENLVGIPVRQGLAEPAARPPSPPRRTLTLPRRAATSGGDDFVSVLDRFIAEAGEGARMAEEEARDRVLQLDPDATMAQGPAFRAWLLQHPRIRIVGGGDAAEVEILPGDGEEEEDGGAIDELNQALSAENLVFLGADVREVVDGRTADVHADVRRVDRDEGLLRPGQGVVEVERQGRILPGARTGRGH